MPLKLYNGYENFSLTLSEVFLASIKEKQQTKPFFNYSDSEEMMDVDANFIKIYADGENNSEGWEAIFSTILIAPYIFVGTLSDDNITLTLFVAEVLFASLCSQRRLIASQGSQPSVFPFSVFHFPFLMTKV